MKDLLMKNKWRIAIAVLVAAAVFNTCGATEEDGQEAEASTTTTGSDT